MTPEPSEEERRIAYGLLRGGHDHESIEAVVRELRAAREAGQQDAGAKHSAEIDAAVRRELAAEREGHQSDMDSLRRQHEQELARVRADLALEHESHLSTCLEFSACRADVAREREACIDWLREQDMPEVAQELKNAMAIDARGTNPTPPPAPWWALPAEQRRDALSYLQDDCHDAELDGDPRTIEAIRALIALGEGKAPVSPAEPKWDDGIGYKATPEGRIVPSGGSAPRRPLPPEWGWHESIDGAYDLRGPVDGFLTNTASAHVSGKWAIYDKRGDVTAKGAAKPRPGETPLTAAQREVEEEGWKRGLFGEVGL